MPSRTPAVVLTAALIALAGTARAQTPAAPEQPSLAAAAAAAAQATPLEPPPAKKGKNPVIIGAIVGALGAAAMTAVVARQYGHNEGYGTCVPCLFQWGTIAVPAGAGIGAGIGWIIKADSPDPQSPGLPPSVTEHTPSGPRRQVGVGITF